MLGEYSTAKYDARNPVAMRKLISGGTALRAFSQAIMEGCLKAANEVKAGVAAANEDYKKVLDSMQSFRNDEYFWWQVAEYNAGCYRTAGGAVCRPRQILSHGVANESPVAAGLIFRVPLPAAAELRVFVPRASL